MLYTGKLDTKLQELNQVAKKATIKPEAFSIERDKMLKRINADVVVLVEVIGNKIKIVFVYAKDGGEQNYLHKMTDYLYKAQEGDNTMVVRLELGEVGCQEVKGSYNDLMYYFNEAKINYICAVSIPPTPYDFAGYMMVGWHEKPKIEPSFIVDNLESSSWYLLKK